MFRRSRKKITIFSLSVLTALTALSGSAFAADTLVNPKTGDEGIPPWIWLVLGGALVLVGIIMYLNSKKKKQDGPGGPVYTASNEDAGDSTDTEANEDDVNLEASEPVDEEDLNDAEDAPSDEDGTKEEE